MKVKGTNGKFSRQLQFSIALAGFAAVLGALPLLQDALAGYYPVIFIGVSVAVAVLRKLTKSELQ